MILPIHRLVRARMAEAVSRLYNIPADDPALAAIPVEAAPRRALGDLAVPLAFELARRLRKAPRVIAQEIVAALGTVEGFSRIEAAPNGYVNFFLDRPAFARAWLRGQPAAAPSHERKAIVEHTAINPNKAAHIGHLRNAALGDALGRLLTFLGREVEIQNYIDDTGVQVADVAVGFRELEHKTLDDVRAIAGAERFDYYCWDLYARVTEWYEEDKTRLTIRAAALHEIERGGNDTAALAAVRRRPDRPCAPEDDAAHEHPLRSPHVGGRYPAPALLDARVRVPEADGGGVPPDGRQAEGLLGHADRRDGGRDRPVPRARRSCRH